MAASRTTPTATDLLREFIKFDIYNVSSSPEFHKSITKSIKSSPETNNNQKPVINGVKTPTAMSLAVDVPPHEYLAKERIALLSVHKILKLNLKVRSLEEN